MWRLSRGDAEGPGSRLTRRGWIGLIPVVALLASCGRATAPDPIVCTAIFVPGIVVGIYDAASGRPVADSASGTVVDGAYTDSLRPFEWDSSMVLVARAAAYERPGSYVVTVGRSGYHGWSVSGVAVTRNVCHVNTVTLRADLSPLVP